MRAYSDSLSMLARPRNRLRPSNYVIRVKQMQKHILFVPVRSTLLKLTKILQLYTQVKYRLELLELRSALEAANEKVEICFVANLLIC